MGSYMDIQPLIYGMSKQRCCYFAKPESRVMREVQAPTSDIENVPWMLEGTCVLQGVFKITFGGGPLKLPLGGGVAWETYREPPDHKSMSVTRWPTLGACPSDV